MRRCALALASLAVLDVTFVPRALAQEALEPAAYEYEPSLAALAAFRPTAGFGAAIDASVAVVSDAREPGSATLALGGRVSTPGLTADCRWLETGGALRLTGVGEVHQLSGDAWTRGCLFRADGAGRAAPGLRVEHRAAYEVRPALSTRRALLRRRYRGQTLSILGSALESAGRPNPSALLPYRFDLEEIDQAGTARRRWAFDVRMLTFFAPERLVMGDPRRPAAVAAIPADELTILGVFVAGSTQGNLDVMTGGMTFVRLDGLRLPGGAVALDVEAALSMGDVWERDAGGEPRARAQVTTPSGELRARGAPRLLSWEAGYGRALYATFDGAVALEDRVDGSIELRRLLPGVRLAGFAAHTELHAAGGARGGWTGGATLSRSFALGRHASLSLVAEAARSWYATLDADERPRAEPAARVAAVLEGHLSR